MKKVALLSLIFLQFMLFSCVTTSKVSSNVGFTQENIIKIRQGMTSEEVIQLFGLPVATEAEMMGLGTSRPWPAIQWYYNKYDRYSRRFTFSQENGKLYLQYWN